MDFFNSFIPVSIKYDFISENQDAEVTNVSKIHIGFEMNLRQYHLQIQNTNGFFFLLCFVCGFWLTISQIELDWMSYEYKSRTGILSQYSDKCLSKMLRRNDATFYARHWLWKHSLWPC